MLNFKMNKLKNRLLLMRWAVLGCLMLAVGAVAVWGGSPTERREQLAKQAAENMLTVRQTRLAELEPAANSANGLAQQLQAHIGEDAQTVLPVYADLQPDNTAQKANEQNPEENNNLQTADNDNDNNEDEANNNGAAANQEDEGEVVDHAPEPWVGDELLTVEANLQQMTPPVSGGGSVLRSFGYGYDAAFDDYRFHSGVDLGGSLGAAVLAPLAGTVLEINEDSFMGGSIVLAHDGKLQTSYYGLKVQPGLQTGQQVIAGEKLGEICAPPPFEESLPPHLHWEIRLDGEALDAAVYGFGG